MGGCVKTCLEIARFRIKMILYSKLWPVEFTMTMRL